MDDKMKNCPFCNISMSFVGQFNRNDYYDFDTSKMKVWQAPAPDVADKYRCGQCGYVAEFER
jgi:hypothetical protein